MLRIHKKNLSYGRLLVYLSKRRIFGGYTETDLVYGKGPGGNYQLSITIIGNGDSEIMNDVRM